MTSRENALCSLLGVESPIPADQYPDTLVLPEYIHSRALDALDGTNVDFRERSIHFRHKSGQWFGGAAIRGTGLNPKEGLRQSARVNRPHLYFAVLFPPDIHMHTHPLPNQDLANEIAEEAEKQYLKHDVKIDASKAKNLASEIIQAQVAVPSAGDIRSITVAPWAKIGILVASAPGMFLMIHKDLGTAKNMPTTLSKGYGERVELAAERYKKILESDDAEYNIDLSDDQTPVDPEAIKARLVQTRATALIPNYVCYAAADIHNGKLAKIVPKQA